MKKLLEKWFCKHNWQSHEKADKVVTYYRGNVKIPGTKEFTREVLICKECGKIKTIEY